MRRLLEAPPVRLPGTAIILTSASSGIPLVLTHHLKHNRVLHERVLLVTVRTTEEPRVAEADRIEVAHCLPSAPVRQIEGFRERRISGSS